MFDQHFIAVHANDRESRLINFALRYQVYCTETGFEDSACFADGLEFDEHDNESAHFLIQDKSSKDWVAGMRVVRKSFTELPLVQHCEILPSELQGAEGEIAEISRLCVIGRYRRRSQEKSLPFQLPGLASSKRVVNLEERRKEPELMMGLIRAAADFSEREGIRYWVFLVTEALARILRSVGLTIHELGPTCQFRGVRRPYYCDLSTFFSRVPEISPKVARMTAIRPAYREYQEERPVSYSKDKGTCVI